MQQSNKVESFRTMWARFRIFLLFYIFAGASSQPNTVIQSVIGMYKKMGLDFREDRYLGNKPVLTEYDFIVVGAGAAGSAVTNRLTEIPFWNVLLLEAGSDSNYYTDIPSFSTSLLFTEYNWNYKMEPIKEACQGLKNQVCPWPAGKGIGGSTIVNAMIYTRGNRRDFDGWAELGNEGWGYDDVLPYFIKSERLNIPEINSSPYHGRDGPVNVEYTKYQSPLLDAFLNAGVEMGYKVVDYHNPRTHVGVSNIQATVHNGRRVGASTAFLKPIRKRKNFHVSQKSHVTKVLINPDTKRVYGVEYVRRGVKKVVLARREVILSAGAFNSPQLLMLSGIGHAEHLQSLGIPVIKDLPVGDNLQEHLSMAGLTFLINETVTLVSRRVFANFPEYLVRYLSNGEGPLTTLGCEGLGYVQTKYANHSEDYPDIEFIFVPLSLASDGGSSLRKTMGISDYIYDSVYKNISFQDSWSIWPMQLYPYSRGYVRLASRDPLRQPVINGRFFSDKRDLDVIVDGLKMVIRMSETKAFKKFGSRLHRTPIPQCAELGFGTDEYWICSARHITTQFHHQCGTCKMGPESDPEAVVNPRLQVYGVGGLRVVDTSIMPTVPGAHTMAAAYMIAEKAADLIKSDWLDTSS